VSKSDNGSDVNVYLPKSEVDNLVTGYNNLLEQI